MWKNQVTGGAGTTDANTVEINCQPDLPSAIAANNRYPIGNRRIRYAESYRVTKCHNNAGFNKINLTSAALIPTATQLQQLVLANGFGKSAVVEKANPNGFAEHGKPILCRKG